MSNLEKFGAMLKTDYLEDISYILGSDMIDMEEKNKFLDEIKVKSTDKEVLTNLKFEDNIDYRFNLVEEDALERGREQEKEATIRNMLAKNMDIQDIADVTGKTIEEIEKIVDLK